MNVRLNVCLDVNKHSYEFGNGFGVTNIEKKT